MLLPFVIAVTEYLIRNILRDRFILPYGLKVLCTGEDMAVAKGLSNVAAHGNMRLIAYVLEDQEEERWDFWHLAGFLILFSLPHTME